MPSCSIFYFIVFLFYYFICLLHFAGKNERGIPLNFFWNLFFILIKKHEKTVTETNAFYPEIYVRISIVTDEWEGVTTGNSKVYNPDICPNAWGTTLCGQLFDYLACAQSFMSSGHIHNLKWKEISLPFKILYGQGFKLHRDPLGLQQISNCRNHSPVHRNEL